MVTSPHSNFCIIPNPSGDKHERSTVRPCGSMLDLKLELTTFSMRGTIQDLSYDALPFGLPSSSRDLRSTVSILYWRLPGWW